MPIVVYQGFSIHGNEPSGANAGLAYAYYLAAAEGPEIEAVLENTVILMDPSFNPDGLQRFAYWANTNRSHLLNPDPNEREYHEVWPGGRTNHYWFDMNRDWLACSITRKQGENKKFSCLEAKHTYRSPRDGNQFHFFLPTRRAHKSAPLNPCN